MLFAHCFTCGKDLPVEKQLTDALTEQGFAVLSFDFAGFGGSSGRFVESTYAADIGHLQAAARYLAEVLTPPSVLVGHSLGGTAVLSAAHLIPSVRAVATIGAPADPAHVRQLLVGDLDAAYRDGSAPVKIAGRTFSVGRAFLEELDRASPQDQIAEFDGATLIMHDPRDQIVGIENAETLYRAARHPKSFVSLDDAGHLLTRPVDAAYVATVIGAWASRYLANDMVISTDSPRPKHVVSARSSEGLSTQLTVGDGTFWADEPVSLGGTATGPTPYDYLSMALAACTLMTLRLYAGRKKWDIGEIEVTVAHRKSHATDCLDCEQGSAKIDKFDIQLRLPEGLTDDQRASLERIAGRCPVHRTLDSPVEVKIAVH